MNGGTVLRGGPFSFQMNTAWERFKIPTDGPYPQGTVTIGKVKMPFRIFVLDGGIVIPVPWDKPVEEKFQAWFRLFALAKGWPTNPDHDRYTTDWRAAWWFGFRGQPTDEQLKTTSGPIPAQRLQVFAR